MKNFLVIISIILAFCSCSKGGDYVDAIPSTATALVAIEGASPLLSDVVGIDTTKTTYLFELAGGEMGLCALGTDGDPLIAFLPTSMSSDEEHQQRLIDHMKECDPENSIRNSELWKHLNEAKETSSSNSSSPSKCNMHFVAQINVLPKQMQACLLLGTPKGTDPADVLLESEMTYEDRTLTLNGHTCSYNEMVKQQIEGAMKVFRPLTIGWQTYMQPNTLLGIFMNVDGKEFVPVLQNNKALNMMLLSTDAIDEIRNNQGNMSIVGTVDTKWSIKTDIPGTEGNALGTDGNVGTDPKAKLVVCLNLQSLPKELEKVIGFLTGKINNIVYKVE